MNKSYEEITNEERKEYAEKLKREQHERFLFNQRCEEIKGLYEGGNLIGLEAFWHTNKKNIDFSSQKEQLASELLEMVILS